MRVLLPLFALSCLAYGYGSGADSGKAGVPGESSCAECHGSATGNGGGSHNLVLAELCWKIVEGAFLPQALIAFARDGLVRDSVLPEVAVYRQATAK